MKASKFFIRDDVYDVINQLVKGDELENSN